MASGAAAAVPEREAGGVVNIERVRTMSAKLQRVMSLVMGAAHQDGMIMAIVAIDRAALESALAGKDPADQMPTVVIADPSLNIAEAYAVLRVGADMVRDSVARPEGSEVH